MEAREFGIQIHPQLHGEFGFSLEYMRFCFKRQQLLLVIIEPMEKLFFFYKENPIKEEIVYGLGVELRGRAPT